MGVSATWNFYIDLTGDGDFADTDEDITDDVMTADWQIGFSNPFDIVSRATTCTLLLSNTANKYSPEHSSVATNFTRGKLLKITSTYDSTTRTHFFGWIDEIRPEAGSKRGQRTEVRLAGYLPRAQRGEMFLEIQKAKTGDEVVEEILGASRLYPPGFTNRWILESAIGFGNELGVNTILGEVADYLTSETGKTEFVYIADQWSEGVSIYGALADTTGREHGRIWLDRSGTIQWWNRHHMFLKTSVDTTLNDTMYDLTYNFGDDVINKTTITAQPRLVGSSPEILGATNRSIEIAANGNVVVAYRYRDQTTGSWVGGESAVTPVASTDYTANSASGGGGTNDTGSVTAAITSETATRSEVTYTSILSTPTFLQAGAKIRGTKITDLGTTDITKQDDDSIVSFGRQTHKYDYVMDNVVDADNMATFFLSTRKDPRGLVYYTSISPEQTDALMTQALTRTVGDRVTVTETQTGVSSDDYYIIGERWSIAPHSGVRTQWVLESATPSFWILNTSNFSELNDTTRIGPV